MADDVKSTFREMENPLQVTAIRPESVLEERELTQQEKEMPRAGWFPRDGMGQFRKLTGNAVDPALTDKKGNKGDFIRVEDGRGKERLTPTEYAIPYFAYTKEEEQLFEMFLQKNYPRILDVHLFKLTGKDLDKQVIILNDRREREGAKVVAGVKGARPLPPPPPFTDGAGRVVSTLSPQMAAKAAGV